MKRVEEIWGTMIGVDVRDDVAPAVIDDVFAWFARVDELFRTWRDDSEIVRLAAGTLAIADSSTETRTVLDLCRRLSSATGGAFDVAAGALLPPPHPPGWCALDPSAVVKGWALDRAGDRLAAAGAERFCINAGGDVLVGRGPGGEDDGDVWRIGIQHPEIRGQVAAVVAVTDAGVATSGRYERGNHVVDPRTGLPATGLASVTVIASTLANADGYSTAVLALGRDGLDWLGAHTEIDAMAVTDDAQVFTTPGFDRYRTG